MGNAEYMGKLETNSASKNVVDSLQFELSKTPTSS